MTAMGGTELATKCLEFCQTLSSQCSSFKFSLMVGTSFSFTLDTGVVALDTKAKAPSKKKPSPSTIRRNARRREEFLKKKQSPAPVSSARPLRHHPSPTAAPERRQVISVRRDGTMPSFSQLDGNVNHSPTSCLPGLTSSASTNATALNPLAGSHCPSGTVEQNADYGDSPPSDAPPPPTCASCFGPTEWGWTRRLQNNTKHGYRCLALCLGENSCITTTIFK